MTLDQLAAASGVSKSMLSQIERGVTNPTFATLWNLTRALDLEFSDLIDGHSGSSAQAIETVHPHFTPEIRTEDGLCLLRILSPAANAGGVEWYELIMRAGAALVSEPHVAGAREHLTVFAGRLEVVSGGFKVEVGVDGTARYRADVAHVIKNPGSDDARALLVVENRVR